MVATQIEKELIADVYINRNNTITGASFRSILFNGYRGLLVGQPALSSIDITSRVFGFCGGAHQQAAVMALEHLSESTVPPNALLLRSIINAAETIQNSIKWFYTSFAPDLTNEFFRDFPLHQIVANRFSAFKGTSFRQGLIGATYPLSLYSSIAGQWPHADIIVPGGVARSFTKQEIAQSKKIIQDFKQKWLEPVLLNGTIESYLEISSWKELLAWFFESKNHQDGDLGLFFRTCMEYGLDTIGGGKHPFLSFGSFLNSSSESIVSPSNYLKSVKFSSGVFHKTKYSNVQTDVFIEELSKITDCSIADVLSGMKAYEVGSLARMIMLGRNKKSKDHSPSSNLVKDIYAHKESSIFLRGFARLHELIVLTDYIENSLDEFDIKGTLHLPTKLQDGLGLGITEAPRGSLAHLVELEKGKIKKYQILAPTISNINVGARDNKYAPLGQALVGLTINNLEKPIEIGLVARSFDVCVRCTINFKKSRSKQDISQTTI